MRRRVVGGLLGVVLPVLILALLGCRGPSVTQATQGPKPAATAPASGGDQYWQTAMEEVYRSTAEVLQQRQKELAAGLKFHVLDRGNPRRKWLALTFDDGPHPQYTPELLAILKQFNVKATFFVVGKMAETSPELVKAEVAAGHTVANHTYHHVNLNKIPEEAVATEIRACGDVIQSITGKTPDLFRPPGGDYNKRVAEAAEALGYTMVLWTDDPGDYASPGERLVETRVLRDLSNGGILLLHDGVQQTVDLLPQLLTILKGRGYEFVTADEMLRQDKGTQHP